MNLSNLHGSQRIHFLNPRGELHLPQEKFYKAALVLHRWHFSGRVIASLLPTGDPKTIYSFHDYQYRLEPRWPNEKNDARAILTRWIPAFRFGIEQRVPIHLGEFGGFEQTRESVFNNPCALALMMDYLNIFDQFDWHWHYYANRGICRIRKDGSLAESYVQEACRRYFSRGTFNANWQAVNQQ